MKENNLNNLNIKIAHEQSSNAVPYVLYKIDQIVW